MRYLTGCYCADSCPSILLLQGVRVKDRLPVVLAVVWEGLTEEVKNSKAKSFREKVMEWFDRQALPACAKGDAANCVRTVGRCLEKWMRKLQTEGAKARDGEPDSWSLLFGVGEMCFYGWKGSGEVHLLNLSFNHLNTRKLTCDTEEMQMQFAKLEPDVGVLLGTRDFFSGLPKQQLKECLEVKTLESREQIAKHVKEVVQEAAVRGAKHAAAILTVTRED